MFWPIKVELCNWLRIDRNLNSRFKVITCMMDDELVYQAATNKSGHIFYIGDTEFRPQSKSLHK